jgi:hypothetical protein
MKSLTVKVGEGLYRRLDRHVRESGRTKNGLIVALLEAYLRRPPGLRGTALYPEHPYWNIVGTVRDLEDVSENVDAYLHGPGKKA